jgi:hypothetical protein
MVSEWQECVLEQEITSPGWKPEGDSEAGLALIRTHFHKKELRITRITKDPRVTTLITSKGSIPSGLRTSQ